MGGLPVRASIQVRLHRTADAVTAAFNRIQPRAAPRAQPLREDVSSRRAASMGGRPLHGHGALSGLQRAACRGGRVIQSIARLAP